MSYAKHIRQKKFRRGTLLAGAFPAGGSVSIAGSLALPHTNVEDQLADVHAQMLLEGTKRLSKRDLQAKLDVIGASLSFNPGNDKLVFSGRVRTKHLDALLGLIAHLLLEPAFPSGELSVLKKREEANLAMAAQDTRTQATAALSRLLYAKTHPNYEYPTADLLRALNAIDTDTLRQFHQRLSAASLVCAVVGDITADRAFKSMEKHFAALPHATTVPTAVPATPAPKAASAAVRIEHKASIDYLAAIASRITNTHKDYPALMLGLQVLGNRSGFTGRLMQTVREEEGLTYGVYSYPAGFSSTIDGYATAWATFAPQLFEQGRAAVLREMRKIAREGATPEEVRRHRELYEARTRVALGNSGALARAAHDLVADGKKLSELDAFPKRVLKLTQQEVNAALTKYLQPDKLSEAAAGTIEKL